MKFEHSPGSAGRLAFVPAIVVCALWFAAGRIEAQTLGQDDDHEHGHLHFSHPLVTESPSPDSKLRLDVVSLSSDEPDATHTAEARLEMERAFANTFSLALVVPFERISAPRDARAASVGSIEVSAKAANFAFAESGVLVGGGLSIDLPTGSDRKNIGSGHLVGIAPFGDAAIKRGDVESVAMLTYSTAVNEKSSDSESNALTLDASVLWRVVPPIELLAELTTSRSIGGAGRPHSETFLAPGLKWRPEKLPKLAIGVSLLRGVGSARNDNALQASAFWHF